MDLAEETDEMEHLAAVRRSLDRMDSMIDRLLAMTRAEDAAEHTETVELTAVVDDAWETSHTEGATLRTEIDEARIEASPELLRSVFENLFRNAAAHNDPPVTVRVGTLPDGEGFYVADDGDGIPADDRETVFE
ncbi:MAG: HAMP domain-containing sensor histidine kinase, partial [Halorubrum sp.]